MPFYNSIIPIMTSNSQDGFTASATFNSAPYKALDGISDGTSYYRSSISPTLPEYFTVTFPRKYKVARYTLYLGYNHTQYVNMSTWEFQGLVDDVWITLHSGSNTQTANTLTFDITPTDVDAIRIKCNSRHGGNSWGFDELVVYELVYINKILILHDNFYKYHDGLNWVNVGTTVTEQDYIDYGMYDISIVPQSAWQELTGIIQVKYYTDNPTQEDSIITVETEPYSVYDFISEMPEILVYTELDEDITVETTTEPFDLYDEFGDSVDVLYYTDDESVNEADLILESNWSPLDELEGDFEVVVWTEEPSDVAQRVLKMTAIPNPQFIKLVNPLKLYGYLEDVLIDDISQTYKNKKETRYLITDENSNDWYVFDKNTREFKIVDASTHESIIENGMTFEDLNSIEEEDWKKWGKEWLNIGVFLKDNERDTIVSVIDNMSYKDLLPRDTSSLSETSLYILNTTARIDISINGNTIKGVLSDDDLTRVQYRVLLNGEHYYPEDGSFTDLSEPPQNIGITFTSKDIKVDELNTVRVEFRDFFGTIDYWEADFIGTYYGLVFKDIYGDYFSTEIGEVLKYLDFGVIVAGQVTVEHEIILKNQYGYDVKNIQLFANTSEFPDGMTIEFSDSLAPFNPQEKLIIPEVLENGEELSFYVRLRTTLGATPNANGSFDIIVKADRV